MHPQALYLSPSLRQIEARYRDQPLMERAGRAAADLANELLAAQHQARPYSPPPLTPPPLTPPLLTPPILILAGPGNNGGDAFVVARLLRERGFAVHVVFTATPAAQPHDAAVAFRHYTDAGGTCAAAIPEITPWSLIIDGLFGIGLTRAPGSSYAEWITTANQLARRDACPLLALDCPSGLNADTGQRPGICIEATHTVTFISGKPGLLTAEGPDYCGEIHLATLALDTEAPMPADGLVIAPRLFASQLKPRQKNSHKGSFGGVGIIGGSSSMVGAALLAGRAALKLGAGRVYLGLLDPNAPSVDLTQAELMLRHVDSIFSADLQSLVCGPGLGQSEVAQEWLEQSLNSPLPLVLDADALNIIAVNHQFAGILTQRAALNRSTLLTPHPAEAARLLATTTEAIQTDRINAACALARRYACPVALKGCGTVIATVDGRWWINSTGNPGMATAGMGDVLSGLCATLLAQSWPAELALIAAVHLHGAAADRLVEQGIGPAGLTAGEVIDAARHVFNHWLNLQPHRS